MITLYWFGFAGMLLAGLVLAAARGSWKAVVGAIIQAALWPLVLFALIVLRLTR